MDVGWLIAVLCSLLELLIVVPTKDARYHTLLVAKQEAKEQRDATRALQLHEALEPLDSLSLRRAQLDNELTLTFDEDDLVKAVALEKQLKDLAAEIEWCLLVLANPTSGSWMKDAWLMSKGGDPSEVLAARRLRTTPQLRRDRRKSGTAATWTSIRRRWCRGVYVWRVAIISVRDGSVPSSVLTTPRCTHSNPIKDARN